MRFSKAFLPTYKEVPADAVIPSHQLMLRAGLVRQLTAGVYSHLPLGVKAYARAAQIVREEMNAIGGQEFFLPALNPESLWIKTGRRNVPDFILSIKERELVLAPTHEEVIADLAANHIQSYKDVPQIWYQIQIKFRNEPRPRSGVLRGRQFTMKDAYSLDASWEGLDTAYNLHAEAYKKIFTRCGLKFFIVGASSGAMGGTGSQEFMMESPFGEDTVALCDYCGYAANIEVASSAMPAVGAVGESKPMEEIATPNVKTIDELVAFLKMDETRFAKSLVYRHNGAPILILMSGNDQLNESKLAAALGGGDVRPIEAEELKDLTGADGGSIGPVNLKGFKIIADLRLKGANNLVSGANRNDFHIAHIDLARDAKVEGYYDVRAVQAGEHCGTCGAPLKVSNAIELGHIFKLGTKYSTSLGVNYLDEHGKLQPVIMGSYGIGIDRLVACWIEQSHDANGIIWSTALAPYPVHLIAVNMASETTAKAANELYDALQAAGVETLFDDRSNVTAGFKFKDADLMGMPFHIIVGEKGLKNGQVEIKRRATGERINVKVEEAVETVKKMIAG